MTSRPSRFAGTAIALIGLLSPLTSAQELRSCGHTSVESAGAVAGAFAVPRGDSLAARRQRLADGAEGTYIGEILAERDSALARWPDRHGRPLTVWVQSSSSVQGWSPSYVAQVKSAFSQWDMLDLPVRFTFTNDSAAAHVHVTFVHNFTEEISGRTNWVRDDAWWITGADIVLAVYHRNGPQLDDEAMRAMSMHEVGHLLGLDHTVDATSIMASKVRVRELSDADRATVRLLYTLPPGGVR